MGLREDVGSATFALDTAPLIYFVERHPDFLPIVQPLVAAVAGGEVACVASTITLLEVLVGAMKHARSDLALEYERILLGAEHVSIVDVTPEVAREAASLRAALGLSTPDAIIAATAKAGGATTLVTNDAAFRRVSGLRVLVVGDYVKP